MRNASTRLLYQLVRDDARVMALTADNGNEIFSKIRDEFPSQYVDYGIAEENMIASAAGLASCGRIPFCYTITNFMAMHAFEFIRNDVCVANLKVVFLGRSSGLVSSSMGPTHQGTEELALLRSLPNLAVVTPATPREAAEATRFAYAHSGPTYIRLEGFNEPELFDDSYVFQPSKAKIVRHGGDIAIISMGSIINESLLAADALLDEGIKAAVINLPMPRPIDEDLLGIMRGVRAAITVEEHSIYGGLGSAVAELLAEHGAAIPLRRLGISRFAHTTGNRRYLRGLYGIDSAAIRRAALEMLS